MIVPSRHLLTTIISGAVGGGGVLDGARVGLYRDGVVVSTDTTIDDVLSYSPRWQGYAEIPVAAWSPVDARDGTYRVYGSSTVFSVTGYPPGEGPDLVAGYYVRGAGGGPLLWLEPFPSAVLAVTGSVMPIVAEFGLRWEPLASYLPLWE